MKEKPVLIRYLVFAVFVVQSGSLLFAFPRAMVIQGIKGPWELSVSLGAEGSGIVFPVEVDDEDARQTLDKTFPVLGTPLHVHLQEYCPDLKWETIIAEDPQGGPAATIAIEGQGAQQEVMLLARMPQRRAVTASIGGLAIREVHDSSKVQTFLEQIKENKAAGLLTVWADPNTGPQEFVVKKGDSFSIPGTPYRAVIQDYMPHYSIDQETKEVKNYSDQPVNPALKVRLSDEQNTSEQWAWSNFSASPHMASRFPIRIEFSDFDAGPAQNRYFVVTAGESGWWLYYQNSDGIHIDKGELNHAYPFKDKEYTFTLKSLLAHGTLSRKWGNKADKLMHPAIVAAVVSDKTSQETVIELNKPSHVKTSYGTLVLSYRQKAESKQQGPQ